MKRGVYMRRLYMEIRGVFGTKFVYGKKGCIWEESCIWKEGFI